MILADCLLNAGKRAQTAQRARKSPQTGYEKRKKKARNKSGWDLCPWEGAVKEETLLHPGKPPTPGDLPAQASLGGEHGGQRMEGSIDGQWAWAGHWHLGFGDQNQRAVGGWPRRDRRWVAGGWNPVQPWLECSQWKSRPP